MNKQTNKQADKQTSKQTNTQLLVTRKLTCEYDQMRIASKHLQTSQQINSHINTQTNKQQKTRKRRINK